MQLAAGGAGAGREMRMHPHALAPVADLPVLQVESAVHFIAERMLTLGTVEHDYPA